MNPLQCILMIISITGKLIGLFILCILIRPNHSHAEFSDGNFEINRILFEYGGTSGDLPNFDALSEVEVSFSGLSITIAELSEKLDEPFLLTLREIQQISQLPVQYLKSLGYEGLLAFPDPKQIDPITARDLRSGGDKSLKILVWVSRVQSVVFENGGLDQDIFEHLQNIGQSVFSLEKSEGQALQNRQLRFWKRFGGSSSRSAVTNLIAGDRPGEVKALIKLRSLKETGGTIHASNAGTETTGKWIIGGTFHHHRFLGMDDDLHLSYSSSDTRESQGLNAKYSYPIVYPEVLGLGVEVGYSMYDASSFAITQIDFDGKTEMLDLSLNWKPLELEHANYQWAYEFGLKGERLEAENSLISGRASAKLITPRLALVLLSKGTHLRTQSKIELRRNLRSISGLDRALLGGVDTVDQATRLKVTHLEAVQVGKWLKENFSAEEFFYDWYGHTIFLRVSADLALQSKRHLPQHQFIGGGTGSVRGYPESPIAGDSGYSASLEYRIPVPDIKLGEELGHLKSTVVPFFDWAETFVNDPLSYESDRSIAGAGIGWEMNFSSGLKARMDFAKPLREIITGDSVLEGTRRTDERVHARISWEF